MRAFVDIEERDGEPFIIVTAPDGTRTERPVTWADAGKRLLVAKGAAAAIADPAALADAIDQGRATDAELARYEWLLFEAAFGPDLWQQLLTAQLQAAVPGQPYLELAIRGLGTDGQVAMQALRWEALHDGTGAVAALGAACGNGGAVRGAKASVPVGIVRLVPQARQGPAPGEPAAAGAPVAAGALAQAAFRTIDRIPRVLFVIGSRLTDPCATWSATAARSTLRWRSARRWPTCAGTWRTSARRCCT